MSTNLITTDSKPEFPLTYPSLFDELHNEFQMFWDRPLYNWMSVARPNRPLARRLAWMPTMDVFEKNGEIIVKTDLPGMKKDEVQILLEDGDLVLKGERKTVKETKEENYYRSERGFGEFYRRLPLPEGVDAKLIAAKFTDGVLEVKIPLPTVKKPEPTKIHVG
jgi:HSP20 family molecular chaperone IbpA